jgi:hypothetical protein
MESGCMEDLTDPYGATVFSVTGQIVHAKWSGIIAKNRSASMGARPRAIVRFIAKTIGN